MRRGDLCGFFGAQAETDGEAMSFFFNKGWDFKDAGFTTRTDAKEAALVDLCEHDIRLFRRKIDNLERQKEKLERELIEKRAAEIEEERRKEVEEDEPMTRMELLILFLFMAAIFIYEVLV